MTDVFDPGNDNDSSSSGGDRPSNNPNDNPGGGSVTAAFTLPYGPAMPDADAESANYVKNLNLFSPDDDSIFAHNFAWMTDGYKQN